MHIHVADLVFSIAHVGALNFGPPSLTYMSCVRLYDLVFPWLPLLQLLPVT